MNDFTTKRCCRCKAEFPADLNHFNNNATYPDGLHAECVWCRWETRRETKRLRRIPILFENGLKRCTACQEWLPPTSEHFHKYKNGLHPRCKECRRVEKILELLNHSDRIRERRRPHLDNPDTKRRAVARAKQWAIDNPERARASARIQVINYRARKKELDHSLSKAEWNQCLEWFHGCCAYCGSQKSFWHGIEMDHFIPLNNPSCPGTIASNILPVCRSCNASKNDVDVATWLTRRYGKRKTNALLKRIADYFNSLSE